MNLLCLGLDLLVVICFIVVVGVIAALAHDKGFDSGYNEGFLDGREEANAEKEGGAK